MDDAQALEEVERQEREGADDLQRPADLFDVAEILLQLRDDVGATFDLDLKVALDEAAPFQPLGCFDVVDQDPVARLRTRPFQSKPHPVINRHRFGPYANAIASYLPVHFSHVWYVIVLLVVLLVEFLFTSS